MYMFSYPWLLWGLVRGWGVAHTTEAVFVYEVNEQSL